MVDEYLTTGEAARLLGVRSVNTVKRMIRAGTLPATQPGSHYRIRRADVEQLAGAMVVPHGGVAANAVAVPRERLAEWARRHNVKSVALFGSAAREEMRADSDVDVVIELQPGEPIGLLALGGMQRELEQLFGRPVDLGTWSSFRPHVRREAERDARVIYEA